MIPGMVEKADSLNVEIYRQTIPMGEYRHRFFDTCSDLKGALEESRSPAEKELFMQLAEVWIRYSNGESPDQDTALKLGEALTTIHNRAIESGIPHGKIWELAIGAREASIMYSKIEKDLIE